MALTKRVLDQLAYDPAGPTIQLHPDGETPGFSARVYPSGKISFVLRYRPQGAAQPKLLTLGTYGVLTVKEARDLAHKALLKAKTGGDPLEERKRARQGETMKDLARVYLERHARPHKKTWKEDERRLNKWVVPALGSRKVKEVKPSDVARLHHRIGENARFEANRVRALLAVMFSKAVEWGILEPGTPNPAATIQPFKERSRDRWITREEMPLLVGAIDQEENLFIRAAMKLYLLTGLRRSELLGLRWRDVDLDRREIHLADTKAGRSHVVPLSDEALEVLGTLPRGIGTAPVFPGAKKGRSLVNISKAWRRIRARFWLARNPERAVELRARAAADVKRAKKHAAKGAAAVEARLLALAQREAKAEEDVRLHDLRRTVGSWLAMSGASLPLIGKVLNHSNASTTQVYARLAEDATRAALEEHGRRIGPLLSGEASELTRPEIVP